VEGVDVEPEDTTDGDKSIESIDKEIDLSQGITLTV